MGGGERSGGRARAQDHKGVKKIEGAQRKWPFIREKSIKERKKGGKGEDCRR